ncbi:MAG: GNAT family N-acetyltransferase [Lachnospiraceae bacterium]|nr:GNAT family N-acetyltransferase [Erysipelotrichaceae bacterium]MBR4342431.1 GNAT family N-acetyltransferase [Lachnospiraceae bacterium]
MLRELNQKDAPLMLEWMHDKNVIEKMKTDFMSFSLENCIGFIEKAQNDEKNIHLAIVDENDEYQGTVSLKHIYNDMAEFAITIRSCAMGKGISGSAMHEIIELGFNKYNLKKIYWCVNPDNKRAVRFYDKNGYNRINIKELGIYDFLVGNDIYSDDEINDFIWYLVENK